jgi:hypothetical protein
VTTGTGSLRQQNIPPELTPRQKAFVERYVLTLNATKAYREAGYSVRDDDVAASAASRMLRNVKVASAIRKALTDRSARMEVSQEFVLSRLVLEGTDHGPGSSHSARVRALELLGKHTGLNFNDKLNVTSTSTVQVTHTEVTVSDHERLKRIEEIVSLARRRKLLLTADPGGDGHADGGGAPGVPAADETAQPG